MRINLTLAGLALAGGAIAVPNHVIGDYIESRTCSVYIGACHYSGEAVTAGHEAVMAWSIEKGSWNGTGLDGLKAVAVVAAADNLANAGPRSSVIYLDAKATPKQRAALRAMVERRAGSALGSVIAVHDAPVNLKKVGKDTIVNVPGAVDLHAVGYPCACCVQPFETWYRPLIAVNGARVASAKTNAFTDKDALRTTWTRHDENSVFLARFDWR